MPARRNRQALSLAARTTELAIAAPQVVAHRVARMAMSGPVLSERDRKEFQLMGAEKTAAFTASWNAMALQAMRANQAMAVSMLTSFWSPAVWRNPAGHVAAQLQSAALGVLGKGIAPVHRAATANARRLAGTRLR
jgi:hypothetical protein